MDGYNPMSITQNEINELVEAYASSSTAIISDNLAREPGAVGIRPFHRCTSAVAGRALTVRTRAGDNATVHKALDLIQPGDFIIVDGGGDESRAVIGEIMAAIAKSRGAVGFVIDGAIRDVDVITADTFPVFAKAAIHRGPYKNGPGEINVPVSVGGMVVNPGDIVVGDGDGIVAFPVEGAKELLVAVRAQEKKEAEMLASIANGTYTNAYAK